MSKTRTIVSAALIMLLTLLAGACGTPATPSEPAPSTMDTGTLTLYVTDAPPQDEVTSIMITVSEVQVHRAAAVQETEQQSSSDNQTLGQVQLQQQAGDNQTPEQVQSPQSPEGEGEWLSISLGENTTFDLLEIAGIEQFLGTEEIAAGKYTQVRLVLADVQVALGGGALQDAEMPSGELKLVSPFDINAGETTAIVLDFDADRMVTVTGNDRIMVQPVIKLTVRQQKINVPAGEGAAPAATVTTALTISCDEFMTDQHLSREVEITRGNHLTVALCSNQTTGFRWSESAQIGDPALLQQTEHQYQSADTQALGAAGQEVWTFQALQPGTTSVSFEYGRPWEGGEKGEWTLELTVVVN